MKRVLSFTIALLLIVLAGIVHGHFAERWHNSEELDKAAARLEQVPLRFGDWVGQDVDGDPRNFGQAGARAYLIRTYTHARTKASFLVILMCGRAGKMAVHTPEVCYRGAGYDTIDNPVAWPVRTELGDDLGTFSTARFGKQNSGSNDLRLYWGWTAQGPWQAPREPRWQFRGEPYLYKLYVSHDASSPGPPPAEGPAQEFLRRFLPELQKALLLEAAAAP